MHACKRISIRILKLVFHKYELIDDDDDDDDELTCQSEMFVI